MRSSMFLVIVGFFIFLTPFFGIPEAWRSIILFVLGTFTVVGALACRLNERKYEYNEDDIYYVENEPIGNEDENVNMRQIV